MHQFLLAGTVLTIACAVHAVEDATSSQKDRKPKPASSATMPKDATYERQIAPYLKKHGLGLGRTGDGILVYQWSMGSTGSAMLFKPGKEGVITRTGRKGEKTVLPLPATEWKGLVKKLTKADFFKLPYRNRKWGFDGYTVYVEVRLDGKHHRVCHWMPDTPELNELRDILLKPGR